MREKPSETGLLLLAVTEFVLWPGELEGEISDTAGDMLQAISDEVTHRMHMLETKQPQALAAEKLMANTDKDEAQTFFFYYYLLLSW